jgi:hypothetical protein
MFKVLHIGNGNEKHLGARYYSIERKIHNGLVRSGYDALFFSDRDVKRTSGLCGTNFYGAERCNQKLLKLIDNFKPNIILLGHANIIKNQTLEIIQAKYPQTKIAGYNVDALFRVENIAAIEERQPYLCASFFTTAGDAIKKYNNSFFIPNPTDSSIEKYRCFEQNSYEYDVFFACRAATTKGNHEATDRLIIPNYLKNNVPELRYNFHGFAGKAELFGHQFYSELTKCWGGLNLSQKQTTRGELQFANDAQKYLYSSDRIAQYLGCGLLTFSEVGFALEQLYEADEHMVFFASYEELADKLRFYAKNPAICRRIAMNGWQLAHEQLNSTIVAQYMIENIMEQPHSHNYYWHKFN